VTTTLIPPEATLPIIRGALGCLRAVPGCPEPVQLDTLAAIAHLVAGSEIEVTTLPGLSAGELAAAVTDVTLRRAAVALLVTLELIIHPVSRELDASVRRYADALGVDTPMLRAAHQFAENHIALMYQDIQRQSWYTKETERRVAEGHLFQILRSKVASLGGPGDPAIAGRWRALGSCPAQSWGRAVYDFYEQHGFTFPGEKGSIREVGAEHDWVHVLADYPPDPEGEIDVFAHLIRGRLAHDPGYTAVQTIPGIGPTLGAVLVAEIGDITRFSRPEQLSSWAGLTPKHHESDTHVHRGRITKQGSRLVRWAVVESVQILPKTTVVGMMRDQVGARRGRGIGVVAAARRQLEFVFYALRDHHVRALTHPRLRSAA